jgi:hypothetical protein
MAGPTNDERVLEAVDRAWVLDGPDHPPARLTADEIRTARQLMVDTDVVSETTLFPVLAREEPASRMYSPSMSGCPSAIARSCAPPRWASSMTDHPGTAPADTGPSGRERQTASV